MNLPNALTSSRILLLILFILFHYLNLPWLALAMIILAGLSDALDGIVAREKNKVTDFGIFYDQFVDKIFVIIALLYFVSIDYLGFILAALLIFRELAMTVLRNKYKKKKNISPLISGKIKMVLQMVLLGTLCLVSVHLIFLQISFWLAILTLILSYYSFIRMWIKLA
jgi:CDP-diacylglycerol---glycerol-3-phosphate 3-phosphatidyltransferase